MGQGLKLQGSSNINDAPPSLEEAYASLHRLATAFRDMQLVKDIANSISGHARQTLMPGGQGPVVIRFTGLYGVLHTSDLDEAISVYSVYQRCGKLSGMPPVVVLLTNRGQVPYVVLSSKFQD
jgi:hypothetical protein